MAGPDLSTKKRLLFLLILYSLVGVGFALRVGWIQVVKSQEYKKEAFKLQTRDTIISPKRGSIFDRNGKELAASIRSHTIFVSPVTIDKYKEDHEFIALKLSEILKIDKETIIKKLKRQKSQYELIARKVEKEKSEKVKDWIEKGKIKGIHLEEDTKRFYSRSNLAAQVIGFTNIDNDGLFGIEKTMNDYLKGTKGRILSEVDRDGLQMPFTEGKKVEAEDGNNVVLTIDETIQNIAENVLKKAIEDNKVTNGGSAIVMDPRTGEILALVSKPDFDLNNPFAAPPDVDKNTWKGNSKTEVEHLIKTVWNNKAVEDTYEPGSSFKSITTAIALEEGLINTNSPVNDFTHKFRGREIDCAEPNMHGNESFREGFYRSCNPVFSRLSLNIGVDRFYKYIRSFGFYDKTGIELPDEAYGYFHPKPTELDMAVASFGQRFNITPLELIQAYGAIANGGKLIKPHLVKEITDSNGNIIVRTEPEVIRNVISTQTSVTLKSLLEGVVSDPKGTGGYAYVKGYRVGGKTATAETTDTKRYVASFAAVAPIDNPVICALVVLDNPQGRSHMGGFTAAPAIAKIIEGTLDYLGVEKKYTELDKKLLAKDIYVPDVTKIEFEKAVGYLRERKLEYIKENNGSSDNNIVIAQRPKPGERISEGSSVILYMYKPENEIKVKVPDLQKKDIFEATLKLNNLGLNLRVNGMGTAVKQSVEYGKEVPKGSVIEVEFATHDPEAQ